MKALARCTATDKLGYGVFYGYEHNCEVWLTRDDFEKVAFINGFVSQIDAHLAAKGYRDAREVAVGIGWRQ